MTDNYTCPNCSHPISPAQIACENCGMNLAIAAVLAETAMTKQISQPANLPISPEILVPRLGDYLVERGLLTKPQLDNALKFQQKQTAMGNYQLLGRILIERGYINQADLDTAITEQIVILQEALKKSNLHLEQRVRDRTNELQQALNKITELNQLKTNFISNISHELRTPLAHMIGYIELLRDESLGPLTDDQTHALSVLLKAYNRLHNLIDSLIEFSMLSQGEMSIAQRPSKISDIVDSALTHRQSQAIDKDIILEIRNLIPESMVLADSDKITWVIGELVENGIKFNHPGGKVQIKITSDKGLISFMISDTGIGINEERYQEVFVPFHQLDGSSTRKYGGTGIGLALVKQIIEAHGSTLNIQSQENKGTSIQFSLPKANNDG